MSTRELTALARQDGETEVLCLHGEVRVLAGRLDLEPEAVAALAAWLSPAELKRAERCHFDRDRRRFIVGRARLRRLLGERLGVEPEGVDIAVGEHGKPELGGAQARSGWQFNLSRCGDLAAFALARGWRVGVDIEALREVSGAERIVEHFFSHHERMAYRTLDAADKPFGFLNCWTRKEAFVKALGTGLSYPYGRFDVSFAPGEPARLIRVDDLAGEASGWRLDAFVPQAGFIGALASRSQAP
jgi:4'-phosphopantetheinyl transferase